MTGQAVPDKIQKRKARKALCHLRGMLLAAVTGTFMAVSFTAPVNAQTIERKSSGDEQLLLDADTLVFDSNNNVVTVKGNVQIFFAGNSLEADRVVYDRNKGLLKAMGKVRIVEATGNIIRSEEVELSEDFKNGFVQSLQIDAIDETYFAATSGKRENGTKTTLTRGVYSVCAVCRTRPGRIPTWRIKAEEIVINDETHRISYKNASFELLGIPVAYLPRFSHPDPRVKQKSGLLTPQFIGDNELGFGVSTPYYIAVDESKDLTLTPTFLTNQGVLADIEWRQRLANGAYTLQLSGIRQLDQEEFTGESGDRELRGGFRTTGEFAINDKWTTGWDILGLSDRTFAEDYDRLTTRVDRFTSNVFLTGLSRTKYFDARALFFNILDEDTATSGDLQRQQAIAHPSIDYDGIIDKAVAGGQLSYTTNFTSLSRRDQEISVVGGQEFLDGASGSQARASAELEWKRQVIAPGGHVITPSLAIRGDVQAFDQRQGGIVGLDESDQIARGQVTAGLEWRYPVLVTGLAGSSHIFEPIAQVFTSPNEGRVNRFLNEDSQTVVLDDTNIFGRDRFAGFDRVEGGTRFNVGITHKAQWNDWLKTDFLLGQSFHVAGENSFTRQGVASVDIENGLQTDRSDIVTRFGITAIDRVGLVARSRFDNQLGEVNRGDVTAFYDGAILDVATGYTFIAGRSVEGIEETSQVHGNFAFQAHEYWTVFGDARYDFDDTRFINNRLGVAFDDKQLRLSLAYIQNFDEDGTRDTQGVQFNVNFRTLGGF